MDGGKDHGHMKKKPTDFNELIDLAQKGDFVRYVRVLMFANLSAQMADPRRPEGFASVLRSPVRPARPLPVVHAPA